MKEKTHSAATRSGRCGGDSHLHTSLSMDAGLLGDRLPPRDAYRSPIWYTP